MSCHRPAQPDSLLPMVDRRRVLGAVAAAGTLAAAPATRHAGPAAKSADAHAEAMLGKIAEAVLALSPEGATSLGVDKGVRAGLKHRLGDRSPAGVAHAATFAHEHRRALDAIDTRKLGEPQRTHVEVVRAAFRIADAGYHFPFGDVATFTSGYRNSPYVVAQNVGAYLDVPQFLDTNHTIANRADAEAYLDRLAAYPARLDGETERLRADAARGVVPPDFVVDPTIKQLTIGRGDAADTHDLVTSLARRTKDIPGDWAARAAALVRDQVQPAYSRQIAAIEALRPRATADAGAWKLPDGEAYYAWALGAATTTTLTPDEVHELGMHELAALHARMEPILQSLGYTQGTVGARMTALYKDPRYLFSPGDKGRAEILDYLKAKLADIHSRMPRAFNTLTKGFVEVKRIPEAAEGGAPGAYGGAGTIDGKEPGRFWINLAGVDRWSRFSLPDLAYHEAIPGHAWQGEYEFRQPLVRTLFAFNAYSEGWGLYAEQLADELGVYDDFPAGRLGYLQSLAFRACRMVVDTGIHAKRWTREQGIDFFVTRNGSNPIEVKSEVERYCTWPGQASGYKVGHTTINRLRDKARTTLGARYSLKSFDDAVLLGGNVPMTVLAGVIDRYIAGAGG